MSQATPAVPSDEGPTDCTHCGQPIRRFGQTRRWCHDATGNVQCRPEVTVEEAPEGDPDMEAIQAWFRNGGC